MQKIAVSRFGGPEVLELVDAPMPEPGPTEVLVQAHTVGVGWPDIYVRTGTYPWQHLFPMPVTPGIEMSGTVRSIGSAVTKFKQGQPVYVSSGMLGMTGACYAEARVVPEERLIPLPENLSLEVCVNIGYYLIADIFFHECIAGRKVQNVLVSGASGGIGTATVQLAKTHGFQVIATVGTEAKRAHSLEMGAGHVINYREEDLAARVADITNGQGVDLALDGWAGPAFGRLLHCMAPWGLVILYNSLGGYPPSTMFEDWRSNMGKCISVMYFSMHMWEKDLDARRRFIHRTIDALASGKVRPPPGTLFPLVASR